MAAAVAQAVADGLTRRAHAQDGAARQWMESRAAAFRDEAAKPWQASMAAARPDAGADASPLTSSARGTALAGLSALVDRLGRMPAGPPRRTGGPGVAPPAAANAVTAYQATWSRLRAEQRLRQALAAVPAGAGPLHSTQLVARALQAMHELSPAYLDAFMAHVDTLLALEPEWDRATPAPQPDAPRRRSRG